MQKRMVKTENILSATQIKAEAARLGFSACGLAPAEPVAPLHAAFFKRWLGEGRQAGMAYMEGHEAKRLDPRLLVEGCRTVVCVALNYRPSTPIPDHKLQIAWYAYGQDYHDIMRQKLNSLLERPYNVLSGGQKTVVNLAAVVLREPDILLLDEPTNHLDMQTLDWFEGFLAKYRGTVLMVSHDRRFLDRVATRTLILEDGICTSYPGGYTAAKEEQERQMLLEFEQYKNQQKQIEAMKAAIKRFREWGAQADNPKFFRRAKMLELRLEKMEMIKRPQLEKPKIPMRFAGDRTGREVLKLTGFSLSFGKTALFEQAELLVEEKDRMAFLGANGTGKTSLLRAIFGDVPFSGTAKFNPSAQLGYIPQEIRFLNDKDSVLEAFRRECVCGEGEARQILAKYYFCGAAVMKRVSSLSGGEKVLLKLAVLLQNRVNFLILDEPTNHIDIETREMLEDALLEFSGTLLFISHDRYFIDKLATKIVVLENRKINVFDGTYADYLRVTGHA